MPGRAAKKCGDALDGPAGVPSSMYVKDGSALPACQRWTPFGVTENLKAKRLAVGAFRGRIRLIF